MLAGAEWTSMRARIKLRRAAITRRIVSDVSELVGAVMLRSQANASSAALVLDAA